MVPDCRKRARQKGSMERGVPACLSYSAFSGKTGGRSQSARRLYPLRTGKGHGHRDRSVPSGHPAGRLLRKFLITSASIGQVLLTHHAELCLTLAIRIFMLAYLDFDVLLRLSIVLHDGLAAPEEEIYYNYTCQEGDYIKTCTVPSPKLDESDLEREKKMLKI